MLLVTSLLLTYSMCLSSAGSRDDGELPLSWAAEVEIHDGYAWGHSCGGVTPSLQMEKNIRRCCLHRRWVSSWRCRGSPALIPSLGMVNPRMIDSPRAQGLSNSLPGYGRRIELTPDS